MDTLQAAVFLISLVPFLIFLLCYYIPKHGHKPSSKLPPGPKPIPIIGNILEIGQKPHESLAKLSKIYGHLMSLKLGSVRVIVVSSPEMAKMFLQKYDQLCSSRMHPASIHALDHHKFSVAWMPANSTWRKLRRICKEQMFSTSKLDQTQGLRMDKLQNLWDYVNKCCINGEIVDIGKAVFVTSLNLMSASLFSTDFAKFSSHTTDEFKDNFSRMSELAGKPNLADYFPVFKLVDPQGILRNMTVYAKKCFMKFDEMINQRIQVGSTYHKSKDDMLDALLALSQGKETEMSFDEIRHLLLDLYVAGTDTSSSTVEWAMTELMRNPEKMSKARTELRNVIPQNERVQESDISRLPYLQAVIKETFRLHPTVPLLLPHKTEEDVEINGFTIPKNTQVMVNVWAIGRDSTIWPSPELFMPERFLDKEIEFHGKHFELIPFGAGRRMCVGVPLANRMVHLLVATLIHSFDWKVEQPKEINTSEKFGLSLQKAIPLKAIPSFA